MPKRLHVRSVMSIFAALALVLSSSTVGNADSLAIHFETSESYHTGSIDGQNGWAGTAGGPINPFIDQEVVTNTYGYTSFGGQSWRMSNAFTDGAFGDWPFSPSLVNEAGETSAQNLGFSGGTRQNHFEVEWNFASTVKTAEQPGLQISTAPDRGDGARMSYIRMTDTPTGLSVFFLEYQDNAPYGSTLNPAAGCDLTKDGFVGTTVASSLSRSQPHSVRLAMDFIDGPRNDVVKVYVDGTLRHTGGSWEDYFRWCEATGQSRTVDSMIFQARSGSGTAPMTHGFGFLIDNLSYLSSKSECHEGDGDGDFEDKDGHHHHGRFHGNSCETQDNNESDDDDQGRHFESTSVDSSTFAIDSTSETLTMVGTGLDSGLPVAFTLVVIDYGGVVPSAYNLTLSDGRVIIGTLVSGTVSVK